MSRTGDAVVIGGGIGGLLAARVLADTFERVTVLERDHLGDDAVPRKGTPQSGHTHGLLARGRDAIETLFPGLSADLVAKGANAADLLGQAWWFNHGVYLDGAPCGLVGLLTTRPVLEAEVRRRLKELPNVVVRGGVSVREPVSDGDRVTGVRVQSDAGPEQLSADLVVDATGRGSRSPAWLEAMGFPRPREEIVAVRVGYVTREYRRKPHHLGGRLVIVMAGCAPDWRTAAMLAPARDRWMVSLGGYLGTPVPEDEAGYLEYARSFARPEIYDVLLDSEPLSGPIAYQFPANQRRRYETVGRFPEGYLALLWR